MQDILKVSGSILEMVNSLEMCTICCITLVAMPILCLRLGTANLSASKSTNSPMFTEASICCAGGPNDFALLLKSAENSGTVVSLFGLDKSIVGWPRPNYLLGIIG
jgi:hypothetical protein